MKSGTPHGSPGASGYEAAQGGPVRPSAPRERPVIKEIIFLPIFFLNKKIQKNLKLFTISTCQIKKTIVQSFSSTYHTT